MMTITLDPPAAGLGGGGGGWTVGTWVSGRSTDHCTTYIYLCTVVSPGLLTDMPGSTGYG